MKEEEITKRGLDLGTINSFTLVGDRILILLDEHKEHTVTAGGIVVPHNNLIEKDSGRVGTELSKRKHLTQGTILSISDTSSQKLKDLNIELSQGDRVFVNEQVLRTTSSYQFFIDRNRIVADFDGLVCIPHTLIEAKLKNG
jgi:hypothetical protein